jgi:hypothetical protein
MQGLKMLRGEAPGHIEVMAIAVRQGGRVLCAGFGIEKNSARFRGIELKNFQIAGGFLPVDLLKR